MCNRVCIESNAHIGSVLPITVRSPCYLNLAFMYISATSTDMLARNSRLWELIRYFASQAAARHICLELLTLRAGFQKQMLRTQ
jgi:hypothetical protein